MFRLTKKELIALLSFSGSLTSVVNIPGHTKCISVNNQQCTTKPTLSNVRPNESIEGLHCYPFAVNLDICMESCNTLNDLSNKEYVTKKKRRFKSECF